ncbi:TPA: hypothetical protein ACVU49_001586 [Vibrio parahaemolyticus]
MLSFEVSVKLKFMILIVFSMFFSISSQAERRIYNKNQGVKPELFDASYFSGQWQVNKPKKHQFSAISHFEQRRKPIVVFFTPSGVNDIDERIDFFAKEKDILHAKANIKLKDRLEHEIESIHYYKYLTKELPNERLSYKENKKLREDYLDKYPVNYSDYDSHSMTYFTYDKEGRLQNYNTISYFDYKNIHTMSPVTNEVMRENIKWYKERFNFDVINETDFVLIPGWMSSFVYIDIVSDDLFLMYGSKKDQSYVSGFKRVKKTTPIPPWKAYFDSLD